MRDNQPKAKLRCAVYTRKSTEDGLEQEFNSLDAQYEACAAYVMSQRHEGWTLVGDRYDDGGFSGGNMERPGLKRLLADVAAGKVDVIVLYKIDRLTRSLADFSKIVEVLDAANASFVSITQAFNTTTSMGRLMLNVLLSFAQFEREVTGERIRDKIAASKRKGLWMGGPVPLGYEVIDRKLVVHKQEAKLVRHIMQRYVDLGSVNALIAELDRDGHRTKVQLRTSGPHRGGCPFRRGTLYHLLSNRIYLGEIVHKGVAHPGEHESIVPLHLWNEVQEVAAVRSRGGARRLAAKSPSMLIGLVNDGLGRPMTPSHATKGTRRYRYYVTRPDRLDGSPAWSAPAHDLEMLVCGQVAGFLRQSSRVHDLIVANDDRATSTQLSLQLAEEMAATLTGTSFYEKERLLKRLVRSIALGESQLEIVGENQLEIVVDSARLGDLLEASIDASEPIALICETVRVRRGHDIRLVIPSSQPAKHRIAARDPKLIALIAEAYAARQIVNEAGDKPLSRIASEAGRCRSRLTKLAALSCMAPDIVTTVVEGRQPDTLNAKRLLTMSLPIEWAEQRKMLGFA